MQGCGKAIVLVCYFVEGKLPPQYVLPKYPGNYPGFPVGGTSAQALSAVVGVAVSSQPVGAQQTHGNVLEVVLLSGIVQVALMLSGGGELNQLDYVTRLKLALLLDLKRGDENDWRALAKKLGAGQLITALETQKSPTQTLLQHYGVIPILKCVEL